MVNDARESMAPTHDGRTPLLAIALPVYNGAKYLATSLGSVAEAVAELPGPDRDRVEVVLCDNHSTDRTAELAREHAPACAYRVVRPPAFLENRTRNWHFALSATRAPWMMMLHADDRLAPHALPALLRACRRQLDRASVVMISGRHRTFADDRAPGRLRPSWPLPALLRGASLRRRVLAYHCALVPFTVMRRSAYEAAGGLDDRYELVQDWDLWIRLLGGGDLYYYPGEFGWWRTHGFSDAYAAMMARETVALMAEMPRLIPDAPEAGWAWVRRLQLAKARRILPDHVPPPPGLDGLPGRGEADATVARATPFLRRQLLRAFVAGTLGALRPRPRRAVAHGL